MIYDMHGITFFNSKRLHPDTLLPHSLMLSLILAAIRVKSPQIHLCKNQLSILHLDHGFIA